MEITREALGTMDEKIDLLLQKADEARGRSETLKMLITGLPSAVWMLTVGGAAGLLAYVWHSIPAPPK